MNPPKTSADELREATEAVGSARWDEALRCLDDAGASAGSAPGLELRAVAAYGAGDPEGSIAAWEDLHALHVGAGEVVPAARAAAMVAMYLMIDTGLMAPIRGWLRRAERLVAGLDETPVHAVVAMVRTYERLWCGDMIGAGANARLAIDLGHRHDVAPAVLIGRVATARLHIFDGATAEGLEILDDVVVTLLAGEVDQMTSGMAYCEVICAAQGLGLYDRAGEWTQSMEHWRVENAFGGFHGRCRVHRAEMLRLTGPCERAETEALQACEELRPWMRREFGWPLTELGTIRLRKGDLGGAEEAFLAAHGNSWSPQPGLALLRLAQGDAATAATLILDAIENPFDMPSKERPPYGGLRRAPLLDAQVEIAVATGDADLARRAADELSAIADTFDSRALSASAALARGRAALAEGDLERSISECQTAAGAWTEIGAPFEVATAHMVLAEARESLGNTAVAHLDWLSARDGFAAFGAADRAEFAADRADGEPAPIVLGEPVTPNRFSCEGDTRIVSFGEITVLIHDLKGLRYLERLLGEPNREFHVLDLVAVERGSLPTTPRPTDPDTVTSDGGHAGFHLDATAREAYRRRLLDIDDDIDDATAMNDLERLRLAQDDRDFLIKELARAVGLDDRPRLAGATSERARTSVTRTLRYALARIAEQHRSLGEHLHQAIRTGTYCAYEPDPRLPIHWDVGHWDVGHRDVGHRDVRRTPMPDDC
ncbi:MAG TPA: hypothetical protein VFN21_07055 [Acidimicrobiales bacterium]|nr:hypothetical protein [Acidimicrobiales bacterium]